MGGTTTSSSTGSSSSSFIGGEKDYLSQKGKDMDGITEYFQYHEQALSKLDVKLSYSDKFFREAFRPMHLMNFQFFNNVIDKFVEWVKPQYRKQKKDVCGREFDPELILYDLFIEYFTEDQHHMVQMFDKNSPMRCVFRFGTALTRTVNHQKKSSDEAKDQQLNEIVEQVFREEMLNTNTMAFLNDELQNQFLKESIKATMRLERSKSMGATKSDEDQKQARYVDLFSLRVLSLLACRGSPINKARFLAQLVNEQSNEAVKWDNPRLRKAIRFILYFSSTLPMKFLSKKQDEEVFKRILTQSKNGKARKGNQSARLVNEVDKQLLWNESQLKQNENLFDDVFELFLEEKFLQRLYPVNSVSLSQEDFARRFFNGTGKNFYLGQQYKEENLPPPVDWIFSPRKVSDIFNELLKGAIREECFLIEKIDWMDESNDIVSLDNFEISKNAKGQLPTPFS